MRKALVIFSRVPIAGKTKTRLLTRYTPEQTVEFHKCFLQDILLEVKPLFNVDFFAFYGNEGSSKILKEFFPSSFQFFLQEGKTLGDKMENAFSLLFKAGYKKIVLIGSDSPQIPIKIFKQAFQKLETYKVVLGPTFDGGYYLIGMKDLFREVFSNKIKWGNKNVLESTKTILASEDFFLLKTYQDIDTPEDLKNFIACKYNKAQHTKNYYYATRN